MTASRSTISVVLATYNGERYLAQQLVSIAEQARPPDEVVVCDDASRDTSVAIAVDVLTSRSVPHRILTTANNLGVTANFTRGIEAAEGNLIVLADQDDFWYREKLSTIEASFTGPNRPLALFTDADLIDSLGDPLGSTLWARAGLKGRSLKTMLDGDVLSVQMHKNLVTGATMTFDARLREAILPMSGHGLHDHWISVIAAALGGLRPAPTSLMAYRIHGANTVGLPGGSAVAQLQARSALGEVRSREIAFHEALLARLGSLKGVTPAAPSMLDGKLRHLRFRSSLQGRGPMRCLRVGRQVAVGDYGRFSRGLRSALYDVVS